MTLPTLLHSGFDTLDIAFQGCLDFQTLAELENAKFDAQTNNFPTSLDLGPGKIPVLVMNTGRRGGYAYQVKTGLDGAIYVFKNSPDANGWNIFVNIGSPMLLQYGYFGAKKIILNDLKGFGAILGKESINRVDYCFDFLMIDFDLKPEQIIAPPNSTITGVIEGRTIDDKSMFAFRGRKLETGTVGKMPNLQVQIYDKRREVIARKKTYWFKVWGIDPTDKGNQIWRIEIRAGKKHLKDRWGLHTFEDIENSFGDIVNRALEKIRYLDDDQDYETLNVTRARLRPIWISAIENANEILFEQTSGLCVGAIKEVYREQMKEHALISYYADARRYAVSIGMSEDEIIQELPIEMGKLLKSYIEKDPDGFLYRIEQTKQKTRFIER